VTEVKELSSQGNLTASFVLPNPRHFLAGHWTKHAAINPLSSLVDSRQVAYHARMDLFKCKRLRRVPVGFLAAYAFVLSSILPAWSGEDQLNRFEFTEPQMGVPFRIVLYAPDEVAARKAARAAFDRVAELNESMSDYETDSELNQLSRTSGQGVAVKVSDDLWKVLELAQDLAKKTDGAFDVTVGSAVIHWRRARRTGKLPDPERLAAAARAVGYQKMRLNPGNKTVELLVPRMKLDLGGIAKGYAIDEAMKTLRAHGIDSALISGGGDMALGDPPPGREGWMIEIAPLDLPDAPPQQYVLLTRAALATSGDVFQRLEIDGKRYSHIVDPRTGIGLTDHSLLTVIAQDCTTADSLATAASVLGPECGLKLIEETPGAEIHIVRRPDRAIETTESSGFSRYYVAD
jgi:FAD:protein FMN transferase